MHRWELPDIFSGRNDFIRDSPIKSESDSEIPRFDCYRIQAQGSLAGWLEEYLK